MAVGVAGLPDRQRGRLPAHARDHRRDHRLPAGDAVGHPRRARVRAGAAAPRELRRAQRGQPRRRTSSTVNLNAAYFPAVEFVSSLATVGILLYRRPPGDRRRHRRSACSSASSPRSTASSTRSASSRRSTRPTSRAWRRWTRSSSCSTSEPDLVDAPGRRRPAARCAARSSSTTSRSPTAPRTARSSRSTTSRCTSRPGRPSRWSARPAPASRRSPSSSRASTTRRAAACSSTATTCATCAAHSLRSQMGIVPAGGVPVQRHARATTSPSAAPDATREELEAAAPRRRRLGLHRGLPHGLDTRDRRARRPALGRPAPARRLRPRAGRRPADPHPRRGDLERRPAHRGRASSRACAACSPAAPRSSSPTASRRSARPAAIVVLDHGRIVEQGTARRAARRRRRLRRAVPGLGRAGRRLILRAAPQLPSPAP